MVMDPLLENIRGLPVELRERIYREFVKIQVKRKEKLHPLRLRRFNHWYLNAIREFILKKVFKWSDIDELYISKKESVISVDCCMDTYYRYYQSHVLIRVPEDELEIYKNCRWHAFIAEHEDEICDRLVICQLVPTKFELLENGRIRTHLDIEFMNSLRKRKL